jgi:FlaA1/EpsC-like NDP-sugar epimerase
MHTAWIKIRSPWAAFIHDLISIPIAWFGAYWIRFNLSPIPEEYFAYAIYHLPLVIGLQAFSFWVFGLYRGVWRFASLPDLTRIIKSIMVGGLLIVLTMFFTTRLDLVPRSVLPVYSMLLIFTLGGARFIYRWSKDRKILPLILQKRVLIVGAGEAGDSLVRDLFRNDKSFVPIGFVDERVRKHGLEIHGVRILGGISDIPELVKKHHAELILIALPSANSAQMRTINEVCESTGIPVRTLPGMNDLMSGRVSIQSLRDVSIDDLLGRDPVTLDWNAMQQSLSGKTVLVSGGAGSIGSELCRQIIRLRPKKLIVLDNSEYHLFCLSEELEKQKLEFNCELDFQLIDVCDRNALRWLFKKTEPQIIFHAAAFKHVPLLQPQMRAAIKNNVLGTYNVAQCALEYNSKRFVLVSTDKAVNPTNIMGASKRLAELVCQSFQNFSKTKFITVRFGNVLGSRGSVLETFKKQLENGGPLTITHPDVTRYFMTIPEASQLILQAQTIGDGGELFVLDMGEPIKIRYMAEQIIRLAGKRINEDIKLNYIGLRAGEKLYEELFHKRESLLPTCHAKIMKAKLGSIDHHILEQKLNDIFAACYEFDDITMWEIMNYLVPELKMENTHKLDLSPKVNNQSAKDSINKLTENLCMESR